MSGERNRSIRVTLAVPTYLRPARLAACLRGCEALERVPDEIVVVIRRGDEASAAVAEEHGARVVAVDEPGHLPPIEAALGAAAGEVMGVIDDDAVPRPEWLSCIDSWFADERVVAVGGPIQNHPEGRTSPMRSRPGRTNWYGGLARNAFPGEVDEPYDAEYVSGGNVCYRVAAVRSIGIDMALNRGAAVHYETDLGLGLSRMGRVVFDPRMVVDHYPEVRTAGPERADLERYLADGTHNMYHVAAKHYGPLRRVVFRVLMDVVGQRSLPGAIRVRSTARRLGSDGRSLAAALRSARADGWSSGRIAARARPNPDGNPGGA